MTEPVTATDPVIARWEALMLLNAPIIAEWKASDDAVRAYWAQQAQNRWADAT